jgi:UDP-N-acetylmuramate dehydrogenase
MTIELPSELKQFAHYNEPMAAHTTFKVGGAADIYFKPEGEYFPGVAHNVLSYAKQQDIPVFILGGGANLVVSDKGIRGIVLDTSGYSGAITDNVQKHESAEDQSVITIHAGTLSDAAAVFAKDAGLSGLEFLAGLPGTVGGAVFMNARCFEHSVSDVLYQVDYIDITDGLRYITYSHNADDWDYKKSPFQKKRTLILDVRFKLKNGNKADIEKIMLMYKMEREKKGHFRYPSAGSVFKNNHAFGKPTGKIIEELGLRGVQIGGAQVAQWHGNFIINKRNATACDIKNLVLLIQNEALRKLNINLESEIIFVGD